MSQEINLQPVSNSRIWNTNELSGTLSLEPHPTIDNFSDGVIVSINKRKLRSQFISLDPESTHPALVLGCDDLAKHAIFLGIDRALQARELEKNQKFARVKRLFNFLLTKSPFEIQSDVTAG